MQLSKKVIEEFKRLYKEKEGKEISNEEAREIATNLFSVFNAVYRPIPKKKKNNKPKGRPMYFLTFQDLTGLKF